MINSTWASINILQRFWLDANPSNLSDPRIEGAFHAVTEDLVDALMPNGEERLAAGQQDLRALFLTVTAADKATDSIEDSPAFAVGRLAGLLDVAGNAIRRVWVGSVESRVERDNNALKIINALHNQEGKPITSKEIAEHTGLDKAEVSRKLVSLESLRLVVRSRLGRYLVSRLTPAGASFAARKRAEKERAVQEVLSHNSDKIKVPTRLLEETQSGKSAGVSFYYPGRTDRKAANNAKAAYV